MPSLPDPMMFHADDRLALFIDGLALHATARALGFEIDYRLLRDDFASRSRLVRAHYYTFLQDTEDYTPLRPLTDWLGFNGYSVRTLPADPARRRARAGLEMEMAVDAFDLAPRLDHAVFISGEAELRPLVAALQRRGLRVSVVASLKTSQPGIADDLRRQADCFFDLADLQPRIARPPREGRGDQ